MAGELVDHERVEQPDEAPRDVEGWQRYWDVFARHPAPPGASPTRVCRGPWRYAQGLITKR